MSRSLVGVAFATLLVAAGGHAQPPGFPGGGNFPRGPSFPNSPAMPGSGGAPGFPNNPAMPGRGAANPGFPNNPGFPAGPESNSGSCSSCRREVTWSGGAANAPKKCPHCGVAIGYVDGDDGTRTNLATGKTFNKAPLWVGALVVFVAVVVVIGGVVGKVVLSAASGSGKKSRKKKPRRRAVIDDDDEEDDAPPRRDRRPSGGKPVPMAALADDDGFEVVGEAPAPPAEPPRRAKAKLLRPDGGPR